jgi:hypothetical protein
LVTLIVIAAILIGLLLRLDAVEQQVNRFRNEWVQLRRGLPASGFVPRNQATRE